MSKNDAMVRHFGVGRQVDGLVVPQFEAGIVRVGEALVKQGNQIPVAK
jgi:hypothetical protein